MKKHSVIKQLSTNSLSLIAGGILPFAFAPFYWFWLAPLPIAGLLALWLKANPKQAALRGWLFGLGMFGVGTSWVYISIHQFGGTSIPLALLFTALLIVVLALFPATQGYLLTRFFPNNKLSKLLLAFPASWVLFEWIRAWFLTGFPWLYLGYSQTNSPLRGYATIFGAYGASFAVALTAALIIAIIIRKGKTRLYCFIGLILLWLLGGTLSTIHWTKPINKPISISIIQGNIPQQLKWSPEQVAPTMESYKKLTEKNWNSDLIIWPEAAIPLLAQYAQDYLNELDTKAKQHKASIILGVPAQPNNQKVYNAAIVLGDGQGTYYKQHLVPFGEYLPFEHWLRGLINFFNLPMSNFSSGPKNQLLLIAKKIKIAPYICYEVAYAELVRRDLPQAQLLITMSNDAWFGNSFAAEQHVQIGQMRSIETGRYMLFATNNGITAIISPDGKLIKTLPRFKTAVLTDNVYAMTGATPWIALGSWVVILGCLMLLIILMIIA